MPKVWVEKKLYSVEGEVRDYVEELEVENERLKDLLRRFIKADPSRHVPNWVVILCEQTLKETKKGGKQ